MPGGIMSSTPASRSPIPYRERPLEYSPPVPCDCGTKALRWISWSVLNPGRRYHTCPLCRGSGGCNFFLWHDPPTSAFLRDLIGDLHDSCIKWKKKNEMFKSATISSDALYHELQQKLANEEKKNAALEDQVKTVRNQLETQNICIGLLVFLLAPVLWGVFSVELVV
ncbi:hypothetical protein BRADI_2g27864v3 [Brachypodium distachyon]|uniref:GRF-type domain-containing protein n=1 Tax=Brachypodium distachyon TaxID=15368 RepID=A0A0Q3G871_BRADI|nr:hypothetical protein BRADI_2g27864v3 [Brachypodium distachyon]